MNYILGIDGGSQSTKVAIYDIYGNIVCSTAVPLRQLVLSSGGHAEHPDDDVWDSLCAASKQLLQQFTGNITDIVGVGLCSIRFCRALLKADGTLSQPLMSWMDARVGRPYVHDNPETAYVTTASGYLSRRLTGLNRDTAANYLGAWPLDRDTWNWDAAALPAFGAPREMLFDLIPPGGLLGHLTPEAAAATGIPEGLPVFTTANDKAVEALGVGCIHPGAVLLSLGTYIAAMTCSEQNRGDSAVGWTNLASVPGRYLYESNGIRRGMWMLSWWCNVLGPDYAEKAASMGMSPEMRLNLEAEKVSPGSDGLMIIPHWLADADTPFRKGMMLGFDGRHGRAHIYRAIMEGIAMTMKNHIDKTELPTEKFVVSGGGSKSDVFMQIFADVMNRPVRRPGENGSAGLGSAICAAVGLGIWPDFDTAAAQMTRVGKEFRPIPENVEIYQKLNEIYRNTTDLGDPIFTKSFSVFG